VLRHKVKEQINLEKNVIAIILNDGVDDLIPLLHPNDASRLKDFQRAFWKSFDEVSYEMAELFIAGNKMYPDRKDFAVEYVQKKISPIYSTIMYAMKSGRGSKEILLQLIEKSLISQTKIDQNRWMFGGLNWNSQEL
jgi:hypothetical protein